ncbi:MAG: hypothetical protein HRT61_15160 [Ekhidna sp.]|nr:hypothetical protein [Ekhidna sp.]
MSYPLVKPKFYFSLIRNIVNFLKAPQNQPDLEKSAKLKSYETIGLFILKMVFLIPVVLFFALVYDPENIQSDSMADRFSPIALLLIGAFILPLVEEIAFRLSLIFKPLYFSLSSSAMMYYILSKAVFQTKISAVDESFVLRVALALSFGGLLFLVLNISRVKEYMTNLWNSQFPIIFYCSSFVFAWMHISKYELIWLNVLLLPILTLPQLFSAIIYGYTRVYFGFRYPLILHFTTNTIAILMSFLPLSDLI